MASFPVIGTAVPAFQAHGFHQDALEQAHVLADQEVDQMNRHFKEATDHQARNHKAQLSLQKTLHAARMRLDYDLARREAIRDVLHYRSASTQSTMIVNALCIGCIFAMLYTFVPPLTSPPVAVGAFSTCLAASLFFLCLSTFVALQLQARMGQYDIHRPLKRYSCGRTHDSFSGYFQCHCAPLQSFSISMFYVGATLTVSSATLLMYLTFAVGFNEGGAAALYAVCATVGVFALWILDLMVPSKTHGGEIVDLTGYATANKDPTANTNAGAAVAVTGERIGPEQGGAHPY